MATMFRPFELGLALTKFMPRLTGVSSEKAGQSGVWFDDLQQLAGSTPNASWTRIDDSASKSGGAALVPMVQSTDFGWRELHV